jgi:uncharacterized protein (DUF885 family)
MIDRRTLLASAALSAAAPALARAQPPQGSASGPAALRALMETFGREVLDRSPEAATSFGLDKGERAGEKRRLDDRSLERRGQDRALTVNRLNRLQAIQRGSVSGMDAVNYDCVDYVLQVAAAGDRLVAYGDGLGAPYPISQLSGAYQTLPDFLDSQHSIATREDADAYVARLNALPAALDGDLERAKHDAGLGCAPPDFAIDRALEQLRALRDQPTSQATLVQSVVRRTRDAKIPGDWERPATAVYEASIRPALDRQIGWLQDARKTAPHEAGVARLPEGPDYYRLSLKAQTTSDMPPAEVHKVGLDLVAQISSSIDGLLRGQGMTQGITGQRLHALFEDPKLRYPNTDEGKAKLIADLNVKVQAVQARLPQYFGVLPKATVQIKRVPKATEAGAPSGYYQNATLDGSRPGAFYINLRDTAEVPSWTLPTLVFHESIPGHHLQISIQQEAPLPFFRQTLNFNAYVEGWALYAEQLADEMGMYQGDPLGRVGYLHDALLRAVRLVLDTGLHSQRWTRERAIAYYSDNLGDPASAAQTEVERYCVWPGQACGYMVGKLDWLRNRDKARKALGARFDIRRFHDVGLTSGAMPLQVLDGVVDRWIAAGGVAA